MGKILTEHIEETREAYNEAGLAFCPSSIYHGCVVARMSEEMKLKIQLSELADFVEFLFDKSEHCDHIRQSDAWKEFDAWRYKNVWKKS